MLPKHALTSYIPLETQFDTLCRTLSSLKSMCETTYHDPDIRLCRKFSLKFNNGFHISDDMKSLLLNEIEVNFNSEMTWNSQLNSRYKNNVQV